MLLNIVFNICFEYCVDYVFGYVCWICLWICFWRVHAVGQGGALALTMPAAAKQRETSLWARAFTNHGDLFASAEARIIPRAVRLHCSRLSTAPLFMLTFYGLVLFAHFSGIPAAGWVGGSFFFWRVHAVGQGGALALTMPAAAKQRETSLWVRAFTNDGLKIYRVALAFLGNPCACAPPLAVPVWSLMIGRQMFIAAALPKYRIALYMYEFWWVSLKFGCRYAVHLEVICPEVEWMCTVPFILLK